jgi:hypothetical protein
MSYKTLKVAELKELLEERGLKKSGTKAELIARLTANDESVKTKKKDKKAVKNDDSSEEVKKRAPKIVEAARAAKAVAKPTKKAKVTDEPKFVKVVMAMPFGYDAYHEVYIQLAGNEEVIAFLHKTLTEGIRFRGLYTRDEVLAKLKVFESDQPYDSVSCSMLEGKVLIDTTVKVKHALEWWEAQVGFAKHPEFTGIAEKVTTHREFEVTDREMYKP